MGTSARAVRFLAIAAGCDLAFLAGLGAYAWSSGRSQASLISHEFRSLERMGAARQAGENRANSAQMGISTGSPRWRKSHAGFESEWNLTVAELLRLAPAEFHAEAGQQFVESERRLFQAEEKALDAAGHGNREEAAALLLTPSYDQDQRTLSRSAEKITGWLRDRLNGALDAQRRCSQVVTILFAVIFPVQVCFWAFTARIGMSHLRNRRRAEERLRDNEQRLTTLFEGIEDAVLVHDLEGRILDCNKAASRRLGYAREELLVLRMSAIDTPDFAAGFANRVASQMAKGVYSCEGAHIARDGMHIPVDINTRVINYNGSPAILATIRDITERKRAEIKLGMMRELAEAASAAKSQFLANMSHEIRTPMNGILGMTELTLETELSGEQREYLQMVKLSADSMMALINDILDFSRIDTGKLKLDTVQFRLRDGLEKMIKPFALRAREKGLDLIFRVAPDVPDTLSGDPARLKQVVAHLVDNAIKFTHSGEVHVTVEASRLHAEAVLCFSVKDTGIGIAPNDLRTIFEPFRQVDGSSTRKYGGTGLGLAISAQFAGLMRGEIRAESVLGKGSVFEFTAKLGIVDTDTSSSANREQEPDAASQSLERLAESLRSESRGAASGRRRRVLVAEDNQVNQRLLLRMLEKRGYSVFMASNGREAVDAAAGEKFDMALFDIQMPVMSGLEATAIIRATELQERERRGVVKRLPIIAVTANAMKGDRESYLAAGMDDYIAKPVRQEELFEKVENMSIIDLSAPAVSFDGALFDGDPEFLAEIVNLFLETYPQLLASIEETIANNDAPGLCRAAHTLKGAVANFGAQAIVEQAKALEMMGKRGDLSSSQAGWRSLRALMEAFVPELQAALKSVMEEQVAT